MAVLAVLGPAAPGWAHSVQISVSPADGSSVPQVPDAVVVTFNETPQELGTQASAEGPDGQIDAPVAITGNSVEIDLPDDAPAGRYIVRWRVTSADGHPIQGSTTFSADRGAGGGADVGTPTGTPEAEAPAAAPGAADPAQPGAAETADGSVAVSNPTATNGPDSANPDESVAVTAQDGESDGLSGTTMLIIGLIVALAGGAGVVLALAKRKKG